VTRPKPPISQIVLETLNQASCDVYSPRAVETLIHQKMNVTDIVFFILYEIYFWFHRSVGLEVNINYITEKVSAMECPGVASLTLAMWQIRSWLLCKFILPEMMVINLLVVLQVFLVGLGNWSEFLKLAMDNVNFGLYDSHDFFAK